MLTCTIRECIREMRKVFSSDIYLYNKTRIHIYEKNPDEWDCISSYKERNGEKILRRIFCSIEPSNRTTKLEELKKFSLFEPESKYNYFRENDYLIPERYESFYIFEWRNRLLYDNFTTRNYVVRFSNLTILHIIIMNKNNNLYLGGNKYGNNTASKIKTKN